MNFNLPPSYFVPRVQQAKEKPKPIVLYPAVTDESTNLTSYCRYDYDDDHYSSINRSPLKMSSLTDCDIATHHARTNGFVTLATAEAHHHQHQNQPNHQQYYNHVNPTGVVTTASVTPLDHGVDSNYLGQDDSGDGQVILRGAGTLSGARDSLLADPAYNGHLSLRYTRHNGNVHQPSGTEVQDGHKTLPDNRSKILVTGPKSPLGKRSKSVTFSQPVAMVTPLPSGSEESMEADNQIIKPPSPTCSLEDGNYDNLNKVFIPDHPISPTQAHTVPILRPTVLIPQQCYNGPYPPNDQKSPPLPRSPLSTFRAEDELALLPGEGFRDYDDVPFGLPPPPPPIANDTYAVVHKKPKPLPGYPPQRQNAQLYETGV